LEDLEVSRVADLPAELCKMAARSLLFCGSNLLAVAPRASSKVVLFDVAQMAITARLDAHRAPVSLLATEGEWLASGDLEGAVHIFSLDSLQHHARVPAGATDDKSTSAFPTAFCFSRGRLIVALSSGKIIVFDVEAQTLAADVTSIVPIPTKLVPAYARVCGIVAPSGTQNKLLVWGHNFMARLELRSLQDLEPAKEKKRRRSKSGGDDAIEGKTPTNNAPEPYDWMGYDGMQHILSMCALEESQWGNPLLTGNTEAGSMLTPGQKRIRETFTESRTMVLTMEVSPGAIVKGLPQAFERKKHSGVA